MDVTSSMFQVFLPDERFRIKTRQMSVVVGSGRGLMSYRVCRFLSREAASNFLTALSLQRKSRSRQQSHQVMSGNIWAALRIALSMMDQPELFQAANIGDLDLLMRAFNLDI